MTFIAWSVFAAIFGVGLGYLASFAPKMAYSIFLIFLGIVTFFSGYIVDLVGGDSMAVSALQMEARQNLDAGFFDHIMTSVSAVTLLPRHVQLAILIFTITFLLSHIMIVIFKLRQSKQPAKTIRRT
jgi:uncharacterized membrane protein HdeD (DUF308 family)